MYGGKRDEIVVNFLKKIGKGDSIMEIRVPHYYRKFKCTADKCPDTCCAGWQIVIDEETLEKYHKYEGAFGNRLANSIDWREGVFHQYEDKRCAFLDENNLCDIYTEAGPELFCRTCKSYPRHFEEFENVREISLAMSCPEAAKLILEPKEPVKFLTTDKKYKEEIYEDFDFLLYSKLTDAREMIIDLLQDRTRPAAERMAMVLAFTHDLQARIYRGDTMAMEDVFARYTAEGAKIRFVKNLNPYRKMQEEAQACKKEMLKQFDKLEVLRESWPELLVRTLENAADKELEERWKHTEGDADLEIIAEHLMIYFIFTYFCGAVYDEEAHSKMKFSVIGTLMILETAKTLWAENPEEGKMAAVLEAAKRYSREVEHSDENIELLEKLSRREGVFGLKSLLTMILN